MTGPPETSLPPTSQNRKKSVLLGASSGYLSTLVTIALSFITVPLALGYFGTDRYGALVVITTITGYFSVTALGIPSACMMFACRLTDRVKQLRIVAKGAFLVFISSLMVVFLVLFYSNASNWLSLVGVVPTAIASEIQEALIFSIVVSLVMIPLHAFYNGFASIKKAHLEQLYTTLLAATQLAALTVTVWRQGSLTDLIVTRGLLSLLVGVAGGMHFLASCCWEGGGIKRTLRQLAMPDREPAHSARALLSNGSTFLADGLALMLIQQTDTLVISHILGIGAVAPYQITFRLVTLGFILFTAITPSLHPLYGAAWVEEDHRWVERTVATMLRIAAALGGLVWIGGAAFAEAVVDVWAGADAYAGLPTVLALGGYGYSLAVSSQLFVLLTSRNRIRNVPLIRWMEAGSNLLLSLILVHFIGVAGAALGTWLASLLTIIWLLPREIRRQTSDSIAIAYRPVLVHLFGVILPALLAVILVNEFVPGLVWRLVINSAILLLYGFVSVRQVPAASRALLKAVRPCWAPNAVE